LLRNKQDCFSKIEYELERAIDKHSKKLIVSNIELFLNYCVRFYDRQFITRDNAHKGILERFEILLNDYFQTDKPLTIGLPSVAYCASELNLSANYWRSDKERNRENSTGTHTIKSN
jgi:AraC family transcriptional activator of pobA